MVKKLKIGSDRGFTLIELMISLAIVGIVFVLCMRVLDLTLITTRMTINGHNTRTKMYENTNFMIREIQSATTVDIDDSGKTMVIRYDDGREDVTYEIVEKDGLGNLNVNGEKTLDIVYSNSKFDKENKLVGIDLWVKGNTEGKGKKEHNYKTKILMRKQ